MSETFLRQIALAQRMSGVDYQQAMFDRTILFRRVQSLLARADLLAMPTITRTALPIEQDLFGTIDIDGEIRDDVRPNWFPWTMPFNMTGHPAVSMPCGFGRDGLPIGLQLGRTVSRRCRVAAGLCAVRSRAEFTRLLAGLAACGVTMPEPVATLLNAVLKDRMIGGCEFRLVSGARGSSA